MPNLHTKRVLYSSIPLSVSRVRNQRPAKNQGRMQMQSTIQNLPKIITKTKQKQFT